MSLAVSLRTAARNLIDTFGNSASLYAYSSATKTENEEGDITVTDWGTATTIKVADGNNVKESLVSMGGGMESIGSDEKLVQDNVSVSVNDRINIDSVDYKVIEVRPTRAQSTLVVQTIVIARVTSITNW